MKLFHVSQSVNDGYDTYSDFVVACQSEEEAKVIDPSGFYKWHDDSWYFQYANGTEAKEDRLYGSWCLPSQVTVKYLGEAAEGIEGIICTSFHAG